MKDWTGNKASAKTLLGVNYKTNNTADREEHDYYATDPIAVRLLAKKIALPKRIYECACGAGHLSDELRRLGHIVFEGDIVHRNKKVSMERRLLADDKDAYTHALHPDQSAV